MIIAHHPKISFSGAWPGTAYTTLFGGGNGTRTLVAGSLTAGRRIEAHIACQTSGLLGWSGALRVVVGGTVIGTSASFSLSLTTPSLVIDLRVVVQSVSGSNACLLAQGMLWRGDGSFAVLAAPACVNVARLVDVSFDVQMQFNGLLTGVVCPFGTISVI